MAASDFANGLLDPAAFVRALTETVMPSGRGRSSPDHCAVLSIQLDTLDSLANDLGVAAAEELYRLAGERLLGAARTGDAVARDDKHGFFVLMSELTEPEVAASMAAKLLNVLARPFHGYPSSLGLTASIGISLAPSDGLGAARLLQRAENARQLVSTEAGSNYQFYDSGVAVMEVCQGDSSDSPRQALERGEYRLCYQPRLWLCDQTLAGAEVLLRWHHPRQGLVMPGDFIPVAEATGLIHELGLWVIQQACRQWRRWQQAGLSPPRLSINVSPRQLERSDFSESVQTIVAAEGCPSSAVEFEITEQSLMRQPSQAIKALQDLRSAGFSIALDDFGTGHSSLACLRSLPLDTLKLDRRFIGEIAHCSVDRVIVRSLAEMAHALKLSVVAEGVETFEQAEAVAELGCDEAQGYYIARPLNSQRLQQMFFPQPLQTSGRRFGTGRDR